MLHKMSCCLLLAMAGFGTGTARAQGGGVALPRVSLGAGVGLAVPFHGDFDFTPWAWEADVRVALARRVLLEVALGEWRHSSTFTVDFLPAASSTGLLADLEFETTRVQRTVQVNVLGRAGSGRVRLTAGGGVGFLQHTRRTRELAGSCRPDMLCATFEADSSSASGSVQAAGGLDVMLVRGLALYGQARFVVPMTDPAGSDLRFTTGVRWGFGT